MRELIYKIVKSLIIVLEPILISIIDIIKSVVKVEKKVVKSVFELENKVIKSVCKLENDVIKNIVKVIENESTILNASKLYYAFLIFIDIFLIISIFRGTILYIPINNLTVYIILFILIVLSILNLLLKHSNFSIKLKVFSISQVLVIIPIIIAYWIVSIEGKNFYLSNLNIDQWSSIFNNIIIYFATCIIGVVSIYRGIKDRKK